jgi:hypothetical protein
VPEIELEPREFRRVIKYNPWMMVLGMVCPAGVLLWLGLHLDTIDNKLAIFSVAAMMGVAIGIFFALLTKDVPGV